MAKGKTKVKYVAATVARRQTSKRKYAVTGIGAMGLGSRTAGALAQKKADAKILAAELKAQRATLKAKAIEEKAAYQQRMQSKMGLPVPFMARNQFGVPMRTSFARTAHFGKANKTGAVTVSIKSRSKRKFATKEGAQKYVNRLGGVMLLSGSVAMVSYGAMDYAGISEALPTQKYLGVSLAGWLGLTSLVFARWVFSGPMVKDGAYGVGISLIAYEAARQVGTRFIDWSSLGDNWSGAVDQLSANSQGPIRWGRKAVDYWQNQSNDQRNFMQQMQDNNAQRDRALMEAIAKGGMQQKAA